MTGETTPKPRVQWLPFDGVPAELRGGLWVVSPPIDWPRTLPRPEAFATWSGALRRALTGFRDELIELAQGETT